MADYKKFQKSITDELMSVKDRVRSLIGNAHWGEDGRYKETIFADVLRRALPDTAKIGTGFVMGEDNEMTSQVDIIVYDGRHAPIFQKDDFVIVPKASVFGLIEVKTKLIGGAKAVEAIEKASANGKIVMRSRGRTPQGEICYNRYGGKHQNGVFNGIIAYESNSNIASNESIRTAIAESDGFLNHIAFGKDIFAKYWNNNLHNQLRHNEGLGDRKTKPFCRFYNIKDHAIGYFISNLIGIIHTRVLKGYPEREDFLFPLPEGKDTFKNESADIEIDTGEWTNEPMLNESSHICENCSSTNMVSYQRNKRLCLECSNRANQSDYDDYCERDTECDCEECRPKKATTKKKERK